jgi:hypothetical protein
MQDIEGKLKLFRRNESVIDGNLCNNILTTEQEPSRYVHILDYVVRSTDSTQENV